MPSTNRLSHNRELLESVPETDLREFLRTRRARITPQEAGLPEFPGVRRVPGLRCEEVAQLAGVSLDYYVRLERGRSASVSDAVLEAVARVLKLDDDEREHLFALARPGRPAARTDTPEHARPGLLRVLDNIANIPALLLSHRLDVLATNHLARALYLDFDVLPVEARSLGPLPVPQSRRTRSLRRLARDRPGDRGHAALPGEPPSPRPTVVPVDRRAVVRRP